MQNLLNFLYRFRIFGFFLVLEGFCFWLIVSYNQRQNASFLNSSNAFIATINTISANTSNYINLRSINEQLLAENEELKAQISQHSIDPIVRDTLSNRYRFISSKVINNTYQRSLNYFTLDIGSEEGIQPGMGVIGNKGVVGRVKSVSPNFSTVTSLLHRKLLVSSTLKSTKTLCTVQWDGISPYNAEIRYIPRHINLTKGDSVITSGFNSVFPPDILIGTVSEINLNIEDAFYKAKINLAMDFTSLSYAYVIISELKAEKDSLELELNNSK